MMSPKPRAREPHARFDRGLTPIAGAAGPRRWAVRCHHIAWSGPQPRSDDAQPVAYLTDQFTELVGGSRLRARQPRSGKPYVLSPVHEDERKHRRLLTPRRPSICLTREVARTVMGLLIW